MQNTSVLHRAAEKRRPILTPSGRELHSMWYLFYWFLVHVIVFECRQWIGSCRSLPKPGRLLALPAGRGGLLSFGGHPVT